MKNRILFRCLIGLCAVFGPLAAPATARTVDINRFDQAPRRTITPAEFSAAQVAATRNGRESGVINFGSGTWTNSGSFNIRFDDLTINGRGAGSTTLQRPAPTGGREDNVINVNADNVSITNMTIRGMTPLRYANGFLSFGFGVPGNALPTAGLQSSALLARPIRGIEHGIRVGTSSTGLTVHDCVIRRVGMGIRFSPRNALSGFDCEDVDFYTLNAMIFASESRPSAGQPRSAFITPDASSRFRIVNADLLIDSDRPTVNSAGDLLHPGRGIELDFGNASFELTSRVLPPVDLQGSVIRGCNIPRVSVWNIALNRVSNVTLRENVLGGSGGGSPSPTFFNHILHMEDQCRNVALIENTFTQPRRGSDGNVLRGASFAWLGGDNGFPRLDNNRDNDFTGNRLVPLLARGRQVPSGANVGDFARQPR